jgi:type IV pilus assembly protein PilC
MTAASEMDLFNQLQGVGMELIQCAPLMQTRGKMAGIAMFSKVKVRDLVQLFIHMEQLQGAGVPLMDALSDVRDSTETSLRDIMAEVYRDVSEGSSLSEALGQHPKVFTNLYTSLIAAGEETGNMTASYRMLIKYLKWVEDMQTKTRKATKYPMVLGIVIVVTIVVMMGFVVPQIIDFIANLDQELPWATTSLMATSDFFKAYWWAVFSVPVGGFILLKILRAVSEDITYQTDLLALNMPLFGDLIRKINIARFSQTFGALFSSGVDILKCLEAATTTVTNKAISGALESAGEMIKGGSPLSESFNASGEFPSLVVRMLRVGEESGNLSGTLDQVAEFYTTDVDEAVEGLISMIEPFLTAVLGIMILWIAVAVFGPIYSSFENMDF